MRIAIIDKTPGTVPIKVWTKLPTMWELNRGCEEMTGYPVCWVFPLTPSERIKYARRIDNWRIANGYEPRWEWEVA